MSWIENKSKNIMYYRMTFEKHSIPSNFDSLNEMVDYLKNNCSHINFKRGLQKKEEYCLFCRSTE